jgi:hypothetical protein
MPSVVKPTPKGTRSPIGGLKFLTPNKTVSVAVKQAAPVKNVPKASSRARAVASVNARFNRTTPTKTVGGRTSIRPAGVGAAFSRGRKNAAMQRKELKGKSRASGFDLGRELDKLIPTRGMARSAIGNTANIPDNEVKRILRK